MGFLDYVLADMRNSFGMVAELGPRFSWLFLLSAAIIALIWHRRDPGQPWTLRAAVRTVFDHKVFLHPSCLLDYRYALVNYFAQLFSFGMLMLTADRVTHFTAIGATALFGPNEPETAARAGLVAIAITVALLALALDFGLFFAHFLLHKVPILWEFHKVHHSAEMLTPLTVFRNHPVDMIFNSWVVALCVGTVNGLFVYLYPDPENARWLFLSNALIFTFYFFGYHLRHSHVWVMFPRGVRQVISSPALHLIHHSKDPRHWDKNFARIFVFWDRLVGSAYVPNEPEDIEFGLGTPEDGEYNSVASLYFLPFKKAAALLQNRIRALHDRPATGTSPAE